MPNICGASNLHAVWDSVSYSYCGFPDLPLDSTDWSWYTKEASSIASAYPINKNNLNNGDFQAWADQSFELAKSQTYPGVEVNEKLSSTYVAQAADTLKTQIMYGGYRLNNLMQQIYGTNSSFATLQ